ncbi:flagellin [Roseateles sp. NT4]|uniref:flagellin N-terminal helical domain-containing protein n=1 Tax=Roseateles sp. NT4 TaxID=3453715 RepID=UPI003EEB9F20
MSATINTNIASLNAQRNTSASQGSLMVSMQRLSSGLRVNSAKDDAAGLAIAERMNTQVRGMSVAIRNANDGISFAQTAEGALGKIGDMLQRMRELAVQSANGTNNADDRTALNNEFSLLQSEITRLSSNTNFNGNSILTGSAATTFQVGANATANDTITITGSDILNTATAAGTNQGALAEVANAANTDISNVGAAGTGATYDVYAGATKGALDSVAKIDQALSQVNTARSTFGAAQNRFDAVISSLQVSVESQSAARSRIMDADYASETANLSRAQILQQAGTAMISQANQLPQQVLTLLRGG